MPDPTRLPDAVRDRAARRAEDLRSALAAVENFDAIWAAAEAVATDIDPGQKACPDLRRAARIAREVARRADDLLVLPEPWESLDGPLVFFVALPVALAIIHGNAKAAARKMAERELVAARGRVVA